MWTEARSWYPLVLLSLGACGVDPVPGDLPTEQLAPPAGIAASVGLPGRDLVVRVSGAPAGASVSLVLGTAPGAGVCPPVLGGGCLGVVDAALVGSRRADPSGGASWSFPIQWTAPIGLSRAWQGVVAAGGVAVASDVVVTAVADPYDVCDRGGAGWSGPSAVEECEVLGVINDLRARGGVDCGVHGIQGATGPLIMADTLQVAARVHTQWMADHATFSHASPGGPLGDTLVQRVENAGYTSWRRVEENIARGSPHAAGAVDQWLRSDDHCANLMSPAVRDLGVGTATGGGATWWTAVFASAR